MATHRFCDLDRVIDEVHALFDAWEEAGTFAAHADPFGLDVLRLAVHEWIANLVQHAAFVRPPVITLAVAPEGGGRPGLRCAIGDNSEGFDFARQIERQSQVLGAPEPSERGRGLLMLIACTDDLTYAPADLAALGLPEPGGDGAASVAGPAGQRLSFLVRPAAAGDIGGLFPLPDEALDEALDEGDLTPEALRAAHPEAPAPRAER